MDIRVILFGQLADIAGGNSLVVKEVSDTDELKEKLKCQYPSFATSKYIIAVDRKLVQGNAVLKRDDTVALLPPFSGG